MKVNIEKLRALMDKQVNGNYNRFARELGLDPSHLHRYLNTGVGGGKKIVFSIMKYSKDKGLDYSDLIEFD